MKNLKFPSFKFRLKIKSKKNYIFCIIRKKFYLLSSEEWVRQHVINFLISKKGYNKTSIGLEVPISINKSNNRADVIVYKRCIPYIIIECKSPYIKISSKVFDQVSRYNMFLKTCSYIMITNGLNNIIYFSNLKIKKFILLNDIPSYY